MTTRVTVWIIARGGILESGETPSQIFMPTALVIVDNVSKQPAVKQFTTGKAVTCIRALEPKWNNTDVLVQERCDSSALAMELRVS